MTSGNSTPASERQRRLSDPANTTWESAAPQFSAGPWGGDGFFATQQLPQMAYGDGPPYSEDEDLHSPVVVSSRHKKHKSTFAATGARRGAGKGRSSEHDLDEENEDGWPPDYGERQFSGTNGEGGRSDNEGHEEHNSSSQSRGLVTYPPDQDPNSMLAPNTYAKPGQRDSHFATLLPNRRYMQEDTSEESDDDDDDSVEFNNSRDSRYSKDYQFTIASPDEEMHGKAVALFDFARENENELPLTEGQVIWVSYRHGQGWLVAEDPKTRDKGLVPEEYVRLVRHIEGGLTMLSGEQDDSTNTSPILSMEPALTPTQVDHGHTPQSSNGSNGDKRPPILSTFSTSSKDLKPYPHHLLEEQARGTPPQVVHYNSQSNTPTITSPATASSHGPRNFEDLKDALEEAEGEDDEMSESEAGKAR